MVDGLEILIVVFALGVLAGALLFPRKRYRRPGDIL